MKAGVAVLGLCVLLGINHVGYTVVAALQLPVPGNLLGMLLLLGLLASGLVPLRWIEPSASLLLRHLALFFVPITVGLMGFADLFLANGLALLGILVASAAVGLWIAGVCSQRLAGRDQAPKP